MRRSVQLVLMVGAAVLFSVLSPFHRTDVAELIPVEVLVVYEDGHQLVIDGGEIQGRGKTWTEAWQDLRRSAPGTVFLGTADDLVLVGTTVQLLPQILDSELLRPAARVCLCPGEPPEPEKAAPYLAAQEQGVTLQMVHGALVEGRPLKLPVLHQTKGGLRLDGT